MKYLILIFAFFLSACSLSTTESFRTSDTQADRWARAGFSCEFSVLKATNNSDVVKQIKIGDDCYPVDANSTRTIKLTPGEYSVNNSAYKYPFKPCFETKVSI